MKEKDLNKENKNSTQTDELNKKLDEENEVSLGETIEIVIFTILMILLTYASMAHLIKLPAIPFYSIKRNIRIYIMVTLVIVSLFMGYGRDILKEGYKNLIHRKPNTETLLTIGVIVSFIFNFCIAVKAYNGRKSLIGSLLFELTAVIIYFAKLGRYMERRAFKTQIRKTKNQTRKIVDKISKYFLIAGFLISIIAFLIYFLLGKSFIEMAEIFVSILIIICPCTLGLITPLPTIISKKICENKGILVNKSEVLENVQQVGTIIFDKTGALTDGKLKITEIKDNEKIKQAKEVIKKLTDNNIETIMLTEDDKEIAKEIAKEIGIKKVIANVLPTEKEKEIEKIMKKNKKTNPKKLVMVCSDEVGNISALKNSDIVISINSKLEDVEKDLVDAILTDGDLNGILNLIKISKKTSKKIKQNIFWSFLYSCLIIPITTGILKIFNISANTTVVSIVIVLTSITIVLNSFILKRIEI